MKRFISMALVLVMLVGVMCSCGATSVVGKWEFDIDEMTKDLSKEEKEMLFAFGDVSELFGDVYVEFKNDGTVIASMYGEEDIAYYKVEGDKVFISEDEGTWYEDQYFAIKGNKIIANIDGQTIALKKK